MQNVKGTYDYLGPEQALRKSIQSTLEELFELYDFDGMDTTILNELELLTSKYAGGDEIIKEMYQLSDQGERSLALRYDLTIPFAKVIALHPGLEFPYKRYEIGKVFRDGPVKRGRLREFLQCDVDVVGIGGPEAEAELMQLAVEAFRKLDIPIVLKWNNRRFLGEVLESLGIPAEETLSVMLTLDKIAKIGAAGVQNELAGKGVNPQVSEAVLALIGMENPTFEQITASCGIQHKPGALEVVALQQLLQATLLEQTCRFDPFLSRGLSFYTGTVYEIFDASGVHPSSLGGGGRYDNIIGQLVGREDMAYPTVGLSFGMEPIMELLRNRSGSMSAADTSSSTVVVIPIGGDTIPAVLKAAVKLRECGIRTRTDMSGRKLRKSLASIAAKGIRYALLIGESEAELGQVRLKDMKEKTEFAVTIDEAAAIISRETRGEA
ncbi:histidine--tRNA ligase [Paenibacillus solisilvae]|uniref:Histidine--tRNA ligase n=1 Tax=Paenibacillus solisilvae TaxID=2486751 RepID=A0ABW0W6B7_9BACL